MDRRTLLLGAFALPFAPTGVAARETRSFDQILAAARGQTVYWNAWAGDERTNDFIAWVGSETRRRFGVSVTHTRLRDTAEAVTRVVAERQAGRLQGGSVDLIWINGPNFLSMKTQGLLHGPFVEALPNWRYVDTVNKPSNVVDFTVPVDGLASPWRMAQIVFVYDAARTPLATLPRSMNAMLAWAQRNRGRLTHPHVRNFMGSTFLKQALVEFAPDAGVLQREPDDTIFTATTAPLWAWYDQLRPLLWREGRSFPETGPAQRQLLIDDEIDFMISFNPTEAAVSIANRQLPPTTRVYTLERGTIGNTSFVAIPFNAANKEGAMVVANFLLEPSTQARAQDPRHIGNVTVLDLGKVSDSDRQLFRGIDAPGMPMNEDLGPALPEPHSAWMTRITATWEQRYSR